MHTKHPKPLFHKIHVLGLPFNVRSVAFVLAAVTAGYFGVNTLKAATYVSNLEAEAGVIAGAVRTSDKTASGEDSVRFGQVAEAPVLPANIKIHTGGASIAIVWSASPSPEIAGYEVYKDNTKVTTVAIGAGTVAMEKEGRRYIDTSVVRGRAYNYQLKTINKAGLVSPLSQKISATHPTSTTPMPTLSFEYIRAPAPSNKAQVEATFRKELETWYPKIGDALAYPDYSPITSLIIETNPDVSMGALGNRIGYNPQAMNATSIADLGSGALLHEATHIINAYTTGNMPAWLSEGIADWTRDSLTLEREGSTPLPSYDAQKLAQGYGPAASFITYIEKKYDRNFPREISIAAHNNVYNSSFILNATGRTEAQLIEEFRFANAGITGAIRGVNLACLDIANSSTANGTKVQLYSCNNTAAQKWAAVFKNAADKNPANGGIFFLNNYLLGASKCLDIQSAGTANNTNVRLWNCNDGVAQMWRQGQNGSLINPQSGRCLTAINDGTASGPALVIADCDSSNNQRWTLP